MLCTLFAQATDQLSRSTYAHLDVVYLMYYAFALAYSNDLSCKTRAMWTGDVEFCVCMHACMKQPCTRLLWRYVVPIRIIDGCRASHDSFITRPCLRSEKRGGGGGDELHILSLSFSSSCQLAKACYDYYVQIRYPVQKRTDAGEIVLQIWFKRRKKICFAFRLRDRQPRQIVKPCMSFSTVGLYVVHRDVNVFVLKSVRFEKVSALRRFRAPLLLIYTSIADNRLDPCGD